MSFIEKYVFEAYTDRLDDVCRKFDLWAGGFIKNLICVREYNRHYVAKKQEPDCMGHKLQL